MLELTLAAALQPVYTIKVSEEEPSLSSGWGAENHLPRGPVVWIPLQTN